MPFEEMLRWASGRPAWQRDALRRFAKRGELTEDDLSALRLQIEAAEGLPTTDGPPEAIPLAAEHLSEAASNAPKTVLASLGPVSNVDRREPGQPPIRFAVNGVTLGPNASGKSGYCRIAKQLCRSLSPSALRGNVYDGGQPAPPEVGVAFRVGGDNEPKTELSWRGNDPPPAELARISVFDTASARVYVDRERKIEFLPYELDLLNKLGLAARALDREFKSLEDALNISVNTPLPVGYSEGTNTYQLIAKLVPATVVGDLPSERELRDLAAWSEQDQAELDRLVDESKNDPQTMSRLRREARQALQTLQTDIADIGEKLGDPAIEGLSQKQQDAATKSKAAESSAHDLFKGEPISNVGSEVWRQMLKYAREFAAEVFPDRAPPEIATAGQCVLCQQDVDEAAAARLAAFDDYLAGRAAEEAAAAQRDFVTAAADIQGLAVKTRPSVAATLAGYAALTEQRKNNAETIGAYFEKAGERLQTVKQILNRQAYDELGALDAVPDSPTQLIDDEIATLDTEMAALEHLERDDEVVRQRAQQYANLADRKRLSEGIDVVVERRNHLEERHRVGVCRSQCRLTAITQQITRR